MTAAADNESDFHSILQEIGFENSQNAQARMKRLSEADPKTFSEVLPWLVSALKSAADPDRSLVNFERLLDGYGNKLFDQIKENPRLLEILITLFSNSSFLTEILLGTPDAVPLLT